ncbi:hypothetical protein CBL_13701 [Carabus blaptoides fortunei]
MAGYSATVEQQFWLQHTVCPTAEMQFARPGVYALAVARCTAPTASLLLARIAASSKYMRTGWTAISKLLQECTRLNGTYVRMDSRMDGRDEDEEECTDIFRALQISAYDWRVGPSRRRGPGSFGGRPAARLPLVLKGSYEFATLDKKLFYGFRVTLLDGRDRRSSTSRCRHTSDGPSLSCFGHNHTYTDPSPYRWLKYNDAKDQESRDLQCSV